MTSRLSGGKRSLAIRAALLAGSALLALCGCRSLELSKAFTTSRPGRAVLQAATARAAGIPIRPGAASATWALGTGASLSSIPSRFRGTVVRRRVRHFPEKLVALTFDDGPDPAVTPRVLKALAEHYACATFFVNGRFARRHPDLLRAIAEGGNAIGNHTYSHPRQCSPAQAVQEVRLTERAILAATGQKPVLFRPPYGATKSACAQTAERAGYTTILWTISSADTRPLAPQVIAHNVTHTPNPGDIIIFHDGVGHGATADALPEVLDELDALGFTCVTLPELLQAWDAWDAKQPLAKRPWGRARRHT